MLKNVVFCDVWQGLTPKTLKILYFAKFGEAWQVENVGRSDVLAEIRRSPANFRPENQSNTSALPKYSRVKSLKRPQ